MDLEDVLKAIEQIEQGGFKLHGTWDATQHIDHCAQAIQFSMVGYPILKPAILRKTIGKLAFHIFNLRGHMSHHTQQITPGAIPTESNNLMDSIKIYKQSALQLLNWNKPLYPHEFYGQLTKKNHIKAHTLHFANHFESFKF